MKIIVFVPGIMGSKLAVAGAGGAEVWPPTAYEAKISGYQRIALLVRPDLVATGVIRTVCIDFYGSLLTRLEQAAKNPANPGAVLVEHAYDWRRDLTAVADELEAALAGLVAAHGEKAEIVLVCHSMGGLIARACLERPREAVPAWLRAVRLAVFLAVPHEGAPLAFARAIGIGGGSVGLSAQQQRQLSGLPGFPAAYQLFPPPGLTPIWRLGDATPLAGEGLFEPALAGDHELNPDHLASAVAFHKLLDPARRPAACRYFAVVSATHKTVVRFNERTGAISTVEVAGTGDGTVPVRSAAALEVQTAYVDADHVGVAQHVSTHDLLDMLLGVRPSGVVAAAVEARAAQPTLSLSARIIGSAEDYEIVVIPGDAGAISGVIAIDTMTVAGAGPGAEPGAGATGFVGEREIPIELSAPNVSRLSLRGPRLPPGQHRFQLRTTGVPAAVLAETELVVMRQNVDP